MRWAERACVSRQTRKQHRRRSSAGCSLGRDRSRLARTSDTAHALDAPGCSTPPDRPHSYRATSVPSAALAYTKAREPDNIRLASVD